MITVGRELVGARGALLERLLAVALEHKVRGRQISISGITRAGYPANVSLRLMRLYRQAHPARVMNLDLTDEEAAALLKAARCAVVTRLRCRDRASLPLTSAEGLTRGGVGFRLADLFPERHGFTIMAGSGRPLSRRHILLRSADPTAHPRIFPEYFSEPEDLRALARSVLRLREMMRGSAIRNLIEAELAPGAIGNGEASIEQDIRARAATFFHPSGTCRMGSDPTAVVDPRLRVNGIQGLRVADASIMPAPLNACTHAPTIMIGEKAAAMIGDEA